MIITILTIALLVVGVIGSAVPKFPGSLASVAGVYLYWWSTGYSEPSTLLVGIITVLVVLTIAGSLFEELIAAKMGGASGATVTVAAGVGFAVFFLVGPVGMLIATALTVFVLEYRRQKNLKAGATAALAVVIASVGSRLFSILISVIILVIMLVVLI